MRPSPSPCLLLLVASLASQGCHLIYPFSVGDAPAEDHGASADSARVDGPPVADGPSSSDGPLNDDAPPPPDAPGNDQPATPDVQPTPDQPSTTTPCSDPSGPDFNYASNRKICPIQGGGNQCKAASACNLSQGWSLCTGSQFRARGGDTTPTLYRAWLASCVRDGAIPNAPSDSVCTCASFLGTSYELHWGCPTPNTPRLNTSQHYMGVHTYHECRLLGSKTAATSAAFWFGYAAVKTRSHAVCCN
jgi:hypothetical protein